MLLQNGLEEVYRLDRELAVDLGKVLKNMHGYILDTLFAIRRGEDVSRTWLYDILPLSARLKQDVTNPLTWPAER